MLIGILSDSHGRAEITGRAVRALVHEGAGVLIHLGDVETTDVLDELVGHKAHIVFGNCDHNEADLAHYAKRLDITVAHPMGLLRTDGKSIAFTHGHLEQCMEEPLAQGVDYLLHGHTHELRDEHIGHTRMINPGALFRARRYTAAILDPLSDTLKIVEIS